MNLKIHFTQLEHFQTHRIYVDFNSYLWRQSKLLFRVIVKLYKQYVLCEEVYCR